MIRSFKVASSLEEHYFYMVNMNVMRYSVVLFLICFTASVYAQVTPQNQPAWWPDASFGLLFHFGLYSVPAGELNGKAVDGAAEMIMKNANLPAAEYEKFAEGFNPQSFSAREWATMAKNSGARYVMITARYRDGFCMWDSKVTPYDVVEAAAYRRDVVGQLAKAVKDAGLKFGVYYSIEDWHHSQTPSNGGANDYRESYIKPQLRELVEAYNTDVILLDKGDQPTWTNDDMNDIVSFLRSLRPSLVIGLANEKQSADYSSSEAIKDEKAFELRMPMSDSWGYRNNDGSWKRSRELVASLIEANVAGGNFLLGVGPKSFGTLAPESIFRLAEIGEWMKQNSEAILTTLPLESPDGTSNPRLMRSKDGKWVYAIVMAPGQKEFKLTGVKLRKGIKPLVLGTNKAVSVSENKNGYAFKLPEGHSCEYACVVKIPVTP